MKSLKETRRRIQGVKNTQKVTRAMKLVAAAKLRRAQIAATDARAFSGALHDAAMRISRRLGPSAPLLYRRPKDIEYIDLVVVTSDRGLCGGFNENLLRLVEDGIISAAEHNISAKIFMIGKKGSQYLKLHGFEVEDAPIGTDDEIADWIIEKAVSRYKSQANAGSNIVFNRFASTSRQEPTFWNLLPLHRRGEPFERHLEYLYEPSREDALEKFAMSAVRAAIKQALLESRAAELAARMLAMDNATKNADEMIAHLTFVYNRARQESITMELMDIVGGAEALK